MYEKSRPESICFRGAILYRLKGITAKSVCGLIAGSAAPGGAYRFTPSRFLSSESAIGSVISVNGPYPS